jgi:signal transduction histidine kinase
VGLRRRPAGLLRRLRLPRRTIRLRLAVLYGGLFFISGAALLAIIFVAVARTHRVYSQTVSAGAPILHSESLAAPPGAPTRGLSGPHGLRVERTPHTSTPGGAAVRVFSPGQHGADLHVLAVVSLVALAVMAAISMGLGWLVAGRVLRPLRTITGAAREISATDLHRRLALAGPDDEFKELGDTFDGLLGRLETSFQAQRQFVANASHELRTPLARLKTLIQVALADPHASVASLRAAHERALASEQQLEELIEALLSLASSGRDLDRREPVELAAVTDRVLARRRAEIERRGLRLVNVTLDPAELEGSPRLLERLVANLIDNAIRHNTTGGEIDVRTGVLASQATLSVTNSGPAISPHELDRLQQPFQRLGADRTDQGEGHGLGLSIVHAIAVAHGATVSIQAQPGGGLHVEVRFPATGPRDGPAAAGS